MGIRTWAAAAAVAACAWAGSAGAGSAGAATYTLNLTFVDGGPTTQTFTPVILLPGDRLSFTFDFDTTQVHSRWYFTTGLSGAFEDGSPYAPSTFAFYFSAVGVLNYYDYVSHPWGANPRSYLHAVFVNWNTPGATGFVDYGSFTGTAQPVTISEAFFVQTWADITPGVPEPSTWAMMLIGFAGLSLVRLSSERSKAGSRTG